MKSYNDIKNDPSVTHVIVPFYDDETATMFFPTNDNDKCLIISDKVVDKLPIDQIREILFTNKDNNISKETIDNLPDDLVILIFSEYFPEDSEKCTEEFKEILDRIEYPNMYSFNKFACIDKHHVPGLIKLCESLWKDCGDDSSTYEACEHFNLLLKNCSDSVSDI